MPDLLIKTIRAYIPSEWENKGIKPVYFLYDRCNKHCDDARSYMGIDKNLRWVCKHENCGD